MEIQGEWKRKLAVGYVPVIWFTAQVQVTTQRTSLYSYKIQKVQLPKMIKFLNDIVSFLPNGLVSKVIAFLNVVSSRIWQRNIFERKFEKKIGKLQAISIICFITLFFREKLIFVLFLPFTLIVNGSKLYL